MSTSPTPSTTSHEVRSSPSQREISRYDNDAPNPPLRPQARCHDADIRHAVEQALVTGDIDDGVVLFIGPSVAGNLLEVIGVIRDDDEIVLIHAMPLRNKYRPLLRGTEDRDA